MNRMWGRSSCTASPKHYVRCTVCCKKLNIRIKGRVWKRSPYSHVPKTLSSVQSGCPNHLFRVPWLLLLVRWIGTHWKWWSSRIQPERMCNCYDDAALKNCANCLNHYEVHLQISLTYVCQEHKYESTTVTFSRDLSLSKLQCRALAYCCSFEGRAKNFSICSQQQTISLHLGKQKQTVQ